MKFLLKLKKKKPKIEIDQNKKTDIIQTDQKLY